MKIILLAGQNIVNKQWIEDVATKFSVKYADREILYYSHWDKADGEIDIELETRKLLKLIDNLEEEFVIFAKSIGTVILLNALGIREMQAKKAILVGLPISLAIELGYNFESLKDKVTFPVNVYQKANDPYCSYLDLKKIEGGDVAVNEYVCIGEEDNNHHYSNLDTLLGLV